MLLRLSLHGKEITENVLENKLLDDKKDHPDGVEESQDEPGTNSERKKVSVMSHWHVRMN